MHVHGVMSHVMVGLLRGIWFHMVMLNVRVAVASSKGCVVVVVVVV